MARGEIVEGLRAAVNKGEPLKRAMMSFYNSGYTKEDIEEAAKVLATSTLQRSRPVQQTQPPQQKVSTQPQPRPPQQIQKFRQLPTSPQNAQVVSDYGRKPRPVSLIITLILVFLLIALLGILAAVFFFKEELAQFFNSTF